MTSLFIFMVSFVLSLTITDSKSGLQILGDTLQYMPLFLIIFIISRKDLISLVEIGLSTVIVFITMRIIKTIFVYISINISESYALISQRPDSKTFDGFPSGHTSACFVGAGYVSKKYGLFYGLPFVLIGIIVAISRVYSERHTVIQVCAGAILGFSISYSLASSNRLKRPKYGNLGLYGISYYKR